VIRILADGPSTPDQGISILLFLAAFVFGWAGVLRLQGRGFARLSRRGGWIAAGLSGACVALALVIPPIVRPDPSTKRPSSDAQIQIVSPGDGAEFRGDPAIVQVRLRLLGGTIVARTSTKLVRDEGHVHLSLDGALVSMAYGQQDRLEVVPGTHRLTAEFVAVDHGPFAPRVVATAWFVVTPGAG
jgi:hypothetical protein